MSHRMQQCLLLTVVAVALLQPCYARRSLQQGDALSNSNGCLATIPKCEAGACATRNIMGTARWACLRCQGSYEAVVDASGQDNIIQCVCPRGTYQTAAGCARCLVNQFCPGGDKVENPTNFGEPVTCGAGLVTRNTGARSQSDCVAPAGSALTSPTSATPCTESTYAPQFNRLGRCLRCQSGLREDPADNLGVTGNVRDTKRRVCKVPPGRYMSQGLVRVCPQGFYRTTFENFDAAAAQVCTACNPGITTAGAGSTHAANCSVVLPGYGITNITTYNTPTTPPISPAPVPGPDGGLPTASLCDLGFYANNGNCVACPYATVTTARGAKTIEECAVPPGYFINVAGSGLTLCPIGNSTATPPTFGTFREGWLMFSDPKATTCTPCGDGILSEPRNANENTVTTTPALVQGTSASCYINEGQGMIATGRNTFSGKDCPVNTYGAAARVYGWAAAPCKPCPRNMITDLPGQSSMDACVNPDRFGYQSEGASKCAPGFYAKKASKKPCQVCPTGRTTSPDAGIEITDCVVMPGFGVVDSVSNSTDAFNPNTTGLTPAELVALPVLECPLGYYGPGGALDSKCVPCAAGAATEGTGSVNATQCTVCIAGYGQNAAGVCEPCPFGSYSPGGVPTCTACAATTFYAPVDSNGDTYSSDGTTLYRGSITPEACVPKQSQMSPEAGQAFFTTGTTIARTNFTAATLSACIGLCAVDSTCMVQFSAAISSGNCVIATLTASTSTVATANSPQFVYKLPPTGLVGASSVTDGVTAKMMSSGHYAHGTSTDATLAEWFTVGVALTPNARTFSSAAPAPVTADMKACKKTCDDSNVCIGFVATTGPATAPAGSVQCYFRGGVDSLGSRAFFAIPSGTVTAPLMW